MNVVGCIHTALDLLQINRIPDPNFPDFSVKSKQKAVTPKLFQNCLREIMEELQFPDLLAKRSECIRFTDQINK